jgi:shikimate kinase
MGVSRITAESKYTYKRIPDLGNRNLVLIGFRATGKSAVGARLAQILERHFVDLDQVLVQEAGLSIDKIVAQGGWEEFRRREKELVARFRPARGEILATGGGVVLDWENVQALRKNGIIIWLSAQPATIQARLTADRPQDDNRPSLTGADPIQEVTEVLKSRQYLYLAAAQIVIDTTDLTVEQVADRVLVALQEQEEAQLGG